MTCNERLLLWFPGHISEFSDLIVFEDFSSNIPLTLEISTNA